MRATRRKAARAQAPRRTKPAPQKPQQAITTIRKSPVQPWIITTEESAILKNAICKNATDKEMEFCLTVARRYRLDPFQQQIWFIRRWDSHAIQTNGKEGGYVWTPQVSMNGLLNLAARDHRDFGTYDEPEYGPMMNVTWIDKDMPVGKREQTLSVPEWARVVGWKKGHDHPTVAKLWWEEIYPDINSSPMVRRMKRLMLAKCAKANVTRTSYPSTGGLLIVEECQGPEFTNFTPSGRLISPADRAEAINVNPSEERWKQREQEGIAKLPPEAQERIKQQRERSAAVEQSMTPCLFYAEKGDGFVVTGSDKLLHENRELFDPREPKCIAPFDVKERVIVATSAQLGKLIAELERRKVPIRAMRQPGE